MKTKILIMFIVVALIGGAMYYVSNSRTGNLPKEEAGEKENIENYFYSNVTVNKKSNLFKKEEDGFVNIGDIEEGTYLNLESTDSEYFKLKDEPYYIYYKNIDESDEKETAPEYENKIDIKEKTYLCNLEGEQVIKLKEGTSVTAKREQNDYYVIFNNSKYSLKQGENIFNTYEEKTNGVPVLMYHFFTNTYEEAKNASIIFLDKHTFENQLKYLKENNFYNPTMKELELFMDGVITLPKKSVILTVDDGTLSAYNHAFPLLEKYNVNAVFYIITGELEGSEHPEWFMGKSEFDEMKKSKNIAIHSHTHAMHGTSIEATKNKMDKVSVEFGVNDINKSSEIVGNKDSFCYPFGISDGNAKEILQKAGYTLAFKMGDGKNGKVTQKSSKLELPRLCIYYYTTQSQFISMVTND